VGKNKERAKTASAYSEMMAEAAESSARANPMDSILGIPPGCRPPSPLPAKKCEKMPKSLHPSKYSSSRRGYSKCMDLGPQGADPPPPFLYAGRKII